MKSPVHPPAPHPLAVKRARWLHHYQAWSPKLKRRISLFSRQSVSVWLVIEASPDIEQFCERPGYVQIDGQRILADFWINRGKKREYFVLQDMPKLTLLDDPARSKM